MRNYIPIEKTELPQRFQIDLAEATFTLEVHYNEIGDFFTVDLYDVNEVAIVMGEKIALGVPLWSTITHSSLPAPIIIPLDESGNANKITYQNFYESVFLYIDDVGDEEYEK